MTVQVKTECQGGDSIVHHIVYSFSDKHSGFVCRRPHFLLFATYLHSESSSIRGQQSASRPTLWSPLGADCLARPWVSGPQGALVPEHLAETDLHTQIPVRALRAPQQHRTHNLPSLFRRTLHSLSFSLHFSFLYFAIFRRMRR